MIEVYGLAKSYGSKKVLDGVSVTVGAGEVLCVIGGSGTGKSTFIKCIIGLVKPDSGSIKVDGREVCGISDERELARIRGNFGYLFQEGALFDSLNVGENVGFGLKYLTSIPPKEHAGIASQKLALVGLENVETLMPSELSGGMKKRVALARAIAAGPQYILYDEPNTGLDPIMSDIINDLIIDLKEKLKVTSIVVTHDMKSAFKIADKIAMLYNGKFIALETPAALKVSDNPYVRQFIEGSSSGPIKMKIRDFDD